MTGQAFDHDHPDDVASLHRRGVPVTPDTNTTGQVRPPAAEVTGPSTPSDVPSLRSARTWATVLGATAFLVGTAVMTGIVVSGSSGPATTPAHGQAVQKPSLVVVPSLQGLDPAGPDYQPAPSQAGTRPPTTVRPPVFSPAQQESTRSSRPPAAPPVVDTTQPISLPPVTTTMVPSTTQSPTVSEPPIETTSPDGGQAWP